MDVPRLEVDSELQLQAYTTATKQDPGCIFDLTRLHSLQQRQTLNPLSEARDQTQVPAENRKLVINHRESQVVQRKHDDQQQQNSVLGSTL